MKHLSRKRTLRNVGLTSAIAVTVLASGIGVASASTHRVPDREPPCRSQFEGRAHDAAAADAAPWTAVASAAMTSR